jgi:hypothetical protein
MDASGTGVKLLAYGVDSYFTPWYFDGKVVYWGNPEQTESDARASAQELKASFLDRLK